jgi:flagellar biosynthesis/type III secretory pathway chaperone
MAAAPSRRPGDGEALPPLFVELEAVLAEESRALKKLDRTAIDRAADEKERLMLAIASSGLKLEASQREAVERLRKLALRNQMLLAHARDGVRQVLGIASGRPSSPVLGGLRLDVRG